MHFNAITFWKYVHTICRFASVRVCPRLSKPLPPGRIASNKAARFDVNVLDGETRSVANRDGYVCAEKEILSFQIMCGVNTFHAHHVIRRLMFFTEKV